MPAPRPWTTKQDQFLVKALENGTYSIRAIANLLLRSENAVRTRIYERKLSDRTSSKARASNTAKANMAKLTPEERREKFGAKNTREKFAPEYEAYRVKLVHRHRFTAAEADKEVLKRIQEDKDKKSCPQSK